MLAEAITSWSERFPSGVALVDDRETLTWNGLAARIAKYRATLKQHGRQRVVLYLPQTASALALVFACAFEDVDAILVSRAYPEPRAVIARELTDAGSILTLDGENIVVSMSDESAPSASRRDPVVGVLTSGSTGEPKCAEHSWGTLTHAIKQSDRRADKRWLLCYPISHIAALQVVAQCIVNRATLIIPADASSASAIRSILEHHVQCISSTPTFMRSLLHNATDAFWKDGSLEQIILGGEIVDAAVLDALRAVAPRVQLTHVYATTELGPVIVVGDAREGFDVALVDGEKLKIEDGELFVRRSAQCMRGYFGRNEIEGDWWATGDLVDVDGDRVRFRGRMHDLINVGGFKVSPAEVELVLRSVEGIQHVCVVAHRSSLAGSLVKAIVQTLPGADHARIKDDAIAQCRARLAAPMIPRLFEFVDQMPETVTHKSFRGPASNV